ncbi:SOS response-associated peptidase family protein [Pseudomonas saliphila]|uniref:SOS response-associated peptidase family protein n=1 Tax=Pseudomonas saliphila TaxID=2586906 RepID=UPI001F2135EE|nr:SOS response-associated peptidase family protein [Pseudomonas saliphila]
MQLIGGTNVCSHYEAPKAHRLIEAFGAEPGEGYQEDLWPTYGGPFVRLGSSADSDEDKPAYTLNVGRLGLFPFWAKDEKFGRRTYNARSETASSKASFRSAWAKGQYCIIPATAISEPDWRSGKAVATRIERTDKGMMAIAGQCR